MTMIDLKSTRGDRYNIVAISRYLLKDIVIFDFVTQSSHL